MKKLVYIDIQKAFGSSRKIYNKLVNKDGKKFISKFKKRYRFFDVSNKIHYSFWFNKKNLFNKNQNKKMKVNKSFKKKFGWFRNFGNGQIPLSIRKNIKSNFKKKDKICLVGGYKKKCLWEMKKTFKSLGYKKVKIKNKYIY